MTDTRLLETAAGALKLESGDFRALESYVTAVVYSDDFNRADGALGANWVEINSGAAISGNKLVETSTFAAPIYRYATSVGSDQWAEIDVDFAGSDGTFGPSVRGTGTSGADNMYYGWFFLDGATPTLWIIRKTGGSTFDTIASTTTGLTGLTSGTVRIEAEGTTIRCYVNGTLRLTQTDSTVGSGGVGLTAYYGSGVSPTGDNWRGGTLPYTP